MKKIICILIMLANSLPGFAQPPQKIDPTLWKKALQIHDEAIVVDTHCDTPMAMMTFEMDIGEKLEKTDVDLIRMKAGGVDASFFAVFISNKLDQQHPAKKALEMIDEIYNQVDKYPDLAEMAFSPSDIRQIHQKGKRAILIGMENGGPIEGNLRLLRDYYRLGVRYITLTHSDNNDICDSSTAEKPRWNGLSPLGRKVVEEMNRLGMMIDISHISDRAFWDVLETSRVPVIASHSCVRSLCNSPRNLSDEMIKALGKKGGVIQINFYSGFLDPEYQLKDEAAEKIIEPEVKEIKAKYPDDSAQYWNALIELWKRHAPPPPDIDVLIRHIDYVVKLVGPNHVGLGSDFDGAGGFPQGLEDISGFPLITYHLLTRGYEKEDIIKILGGNLLRVFEQVEKSSREFLTTH